MVARRGWHVGLLLLFAGTAAWGENSRWNVFSDEASAPQGQVGDTVSGDDSGAADDSGEGEDSSGGDDTGGADDSGTGGDSADSGDSGVLLGGDSGCPLDVDAWYRGGLSCGHAGPASGSAWVLASLLPLLARRRRG